MAQIDGIGIWEALGRASRSLKIQIQGSRVPLEDVYKSLSYNLIVVIVGLYNYVNFENVWHCGIGSGYRAGL